MSKEIIGGYGIHDLCKKTVFKKDAKGLDTKEIVSIVYTIEDKDGRVLGTYTSQQEAEDAFILLMNQLYPTNPKSITFKK